MLRTYLLVFIFVISWTIIGCSDSKNIIGNYYALDGNLQNNLYLTTIDSCKIEIYGTARAPELLKGSYWLDSNHIVFSFIGKNPNFYKGGEFLYSNNGFILYKNKTDSLLFEKVSKKEAKRRGKIDFYYTSRKISGEEREIIIREFGQLSK